LTPNPARPAFGFALCTLDEIADPGSRGFVFRDGEALFAGFVVREGAKVRGYVDSCPHAGWPLAATPNRYLTKDSRYIFCSGHGALFTRDDGECVSGPCYGERLEPWPVQVVRGIVRVA
jgi:nitrite reductase/ring-hydroxylating ferredoxin subunit